MDNESVGVPPEDREEEALRLARDLPGQVSRLRAKAKAYKLAIAAGSAESVVEPEAASWREPEKS